MVPPRIIVFAIKIFVLRSVTVRSHYRDKNTSGSRGFPGLLSCFDRFTLDGAYGGTPEIFKSSVSFSLLGFTIMGRGRGKGKKSTVSNHEDPGSGEEEKIPAQKRRGRPQKPLKDEIDEEEAEKIEEEDSEYAKNGVSNKEMKSSTAAENGKKRKRNSQAKEKPDSIKEENGVGTRSSTDDSSKSNGFRHNGSRRKSKPRRAAEAGVECKRDQ